MKKTFITFIIAAIAATVSVATVSAIAATPSSTSTGICYDGSKWSLTLVRSGSKVVSNLTVQPTLRKADWIVNYAYTPSNVVAYQTVKSDSRGKLVATRTYYTESRTGVLIFTDNSGVMYCVAYGEI